MCSREAAAAIVAVSEAVILAEIIVAAGWRGPARLVKIRHLTDVLHCNFHHNYQAERLPVEDELQSAPCMNQLRSGVTGSVAGGSSP